MHQIQMIPQTWKSTEEHVYNSLLIKAQVPET